MYKNALGTSLNDILLEKDIKSICFDLDNTLLDTDNYYVKIKNAVFKDFVDTYFDENEREEKLKKLEEAASSRYKYRHQHGLKPPLIFEECYVTITDSFPDLSDDRLEEIIHKHTDNFYKLSPEIYPNAVKLLDFLAETDSISHIFGATDAQEDWSRIKVQYILSKTKLKDFLYYSTDLKIRKDPKWWLSIFADHGTNPENIMVVGDNYYADVYSSLLAGVKHAIWINKYGKSLDDFTEYPLPKHAEIIVVGSLEEILKL